MSLLPLAPPSSQRTHPSPPVLLEPVLCPGADEDADTPVPMCMYPQPAVPDVTWKSSCRSGLLPTLPRAAGFAFTSPGENLAGRKGPGWSCHLHSITGVATMQRGWKALWCSRCGARVSLNSRCGFWHQGNVWVHPPGQGSSSTSKDWRWSGIGPGLWSVTKSGRPSLVPCGSLCTRHGTRVGQCHQRGWRVAPGTGPWWHYPSLAPAKRRMTAPHVSQGTIQLLAPLCSGD